LPDEGRKKISKREAESERKKGPSDREVTISTSKGERKIEPKSKKPHVLEKELQDKRGGGLFQQKGKEGTCGKKEARRKLLTASVGGRGGLRTPIVKGERNLISLSMGRGGGGVGCGGVGGGGGGGGGGGRGR